MVELEERKSLDPKASASLTTSSPPFTATPPADAPDAPIAGWNAGSEAGAYAFRYTDTSPAHRPSPLVKAAVVGGALAVSQVGGGHAGPRTVTLPVDAYAKDSGVEGGVVEGYKDLDALAAALEAGLGSGGGGEGAAVGVPGGSGGGVPAPGGGGGPGPAGPGDGGGAYGTRHPRPPGEDDLYPPGLGPGLPGLTGGPGGIGPFHPPMPGGDGGGGVHVGPGDPLFGGHPGFGGAGAPPGGGGGIPPPGLPPGARWDPVAPPGLPGFAPGDFTRPPPGPPDMRPPHPDIMPPGPGGGNPGFGGGMLG